MAYVFISYSHKDKEYAHKLADELKRRGIDAWIDDRIDYGTKWPHVIQENLDKCSAFIVVMTPRSYESDWVQNELSRAQEKGKSIFPLLLEGDTSWLSVQSIQYVDVRGGQLPPPRFYEMFSKTLNEKTSGVKQKTKTYKFSKGHMLNGRYEIQEGLAHGEVFELYRALDISLMLDVFLCVNIVHLALDSISDLKKSSILYASMQHPNLPSARDYFTNNSMFFIVLEYKQMKSYESVVKFIEGILV